MVKLPLKRSMVTINLKKRKVKPSSRSLSYKTTTERKVQKEDQISTYFLSINVYVSDTLHYPNKIKGFNFG